MKNLFDITAKTVLITGGSSGLGLMMATGLLRAGARVYISARKAEQLERARQTLAEVGEVHTIQCDLGTAEGVGTLVENFLARETQLHVLINNAGKSWGAPFEKYPDSVWSGLMALNVQAPFMLSQRLLPALKLAASGQDPSRIINIGSIAGLASDKLNAFAYGPSKAALHHLTRLLALELASKNILVNAIAPGLFPSKMSAAILKNEPLSEQMRSEIPLQRFGTPDDIAGLAIYLSSRASAFMTGNVIPLDGGTSI